MADSKTDGGGGDGGDGKAAGGGGGGDHHEGGDGGGPPPLFVAGAPPAPRSRSRGRRRRSGTRSGSGSRRRRSGSGGSRRRGEERESYASYVRNRGAFQHQTDSRGGRDRDRDSRGGRDRDRDSRGGGGFGPPAMYDEGRGRAQLLAEVYHMLHLGPGWVAAWEAHCRAHRQYYDPALLSDNFLRDGLAEVRRGAQQARAEAPRDGVYQVSRRGLDPIPTHELTRLAHARGLDLAGCRGRDDVVAVLKQAMCRVESCNANRDGHCHRAAACRYIHVNSQR